MRVRAVNKVMEAAIQGHRRAGHSRVSPGLEAKVGADGKLVRPDKFSSDVTCTGYEAGAEILSRDGKTKYQVQADGSHRKMLEGQAPGEFGEVLKASIGRNKKRRSR